MKQEYIDLANEYDVDLRPSREEYLGEVKINSGKIRVSDWSAPIDDSDVLNIEVKNGKWLGKSFVGFSDWRFSDICDNYLLLNEHKNKINEKYREAFAQLDFLEASKSKDFIHYKLSLAERDEVRELQRELGISRDPQYDIQNSLFCSMKSIIIVHEDYKENEAFYLESLEGLSYEKVGNVETNGSAIGLFDYDYFVRQKENTENLSDIYYAASTKDHELLEALGIKRKYAASKVENSGFVSNTGFGGGMFEVYGVKNSEGKIILLHIKL